MFLDEPRNDPEDRGTLEGLPALSDRHCSLRAGYKTCLLELLGRLSQLGLLSLLGRLGLLGLLTS